MNTRLLLALLTSQITLTAASGSAIADEDATLLDTIIVTATRTPQTLSETIAPIIVIDRDDIERSQALDAADLLRFHAGIDIGRNGGPGQVTSIFIRGTESNHTLVLVDGVRINPGTIGGAAIQNIHPDLIERIEIVKGPRSVLYGSNAIGGVVNIITRRNKGSGTQSFAHFSSGSYNTKQGSVGLHHNASAWRLGLDLNLLDSDGFPTRQESTLDRGYNNRSINAYAGTTVNSLDIELSHWLSDSNTEYLDFSLSPLDQDQTNSATTLKLGYTGIENFTSTAIVSLVTDDIEQNQSNDFVQTNNVIVDWQNDIAIGNNQLFSAGLWLSRENNESLAFGTTFDEDTDIDAFYVQDQLNFGNHRLVLGARHSDHSDFGGELTWSAEYGIQITPRTRISTSAGTAFRAPDATDRFGFGGNPELDPERARNIEIGLQHQINNTQSIRIAAFRNEIKNLINFFDPDGFLGPIEGVNVNVDKATINGLELGYQGAHGSWGYGIEAIIQDPRNDDTGRVLARRAKRSLTTQINYTVGKVQLGGDLLLTSRRNDSDFSTEENAGYLLVNTGVSYRLTPEYTVSTKIENLLDSQYQLANNFNTPGRGLYVEFRYSPAS